MRQSLLIFAIIAGFWLAGLWLDGRLRGWRWRRRATDPLQVPLLHLSPSDTFTLRDLLSGGVLILGRTGSGKTSSSGMALAHAILTLGGKR